MRLIENVVYNQVNETWSFTIDGLAHYLTNAGKGVNDGRSFKWIPPAGDSNDIFRIFGDGNLLENDEITMSYILNRPGTDQFYLISVDAFRNNMQLVEEG